MSERGLQKDGGMWVRQHNQGDDMAHVTEASVPSLIRGALDDVRELFREELALARAEMREELGKATASAARFGAGGVALWFAAMFLLVTIALVISSLLEWPAWAGFGIVALVLAIAGAVLVMSGRSALRDVRPMPRTLQSMKENLR
jgi:hypothetical protein